MRKIYIKRTFLWFSKILISLLAFWSKDVLGNTYPIIRFFFKKSLSVPRFMKRNVKTEEMEENFQDKLFNAQKLYKKNGRLFNTNNIEGLKKLNELVSSKELVVYFLVRKAKPKVVVETGVAAGVLTGFILQALKDNGGGKLYSVDLPFQWYKYGSNNELHLDSLPSGKMPGYIVPKSLKKNWKLILGDTYEKLPMLTKKLKKIDIFLHDSEHTHKTMMFEYKTAWPLIEKSGYLLSDDVGFNKAFNDFTTKNSLKSVVLKDFGIARKT